MALAFLVQRLIATTEDDVIRDLAISTFMASELLRDARSFMSRTVAVTAKDDQLVQLRIEQPGGVGPWQVIGICRVYSQKQCFGSGMGATDARDQRQ
jgi:hypothetical protein